MINLQKKCTEEKAAVQLLFSRLTKSDSLYFPFV